MITVITITMLKPLTSQLFLFIKFFKHAKLDALSDWASVVALSCIAAERTMVGYNDMADVSQYWNLLRVHLVISTE